MTRSDDELLHDALRADAGNAEPLPNGFDSVRAEALSRGRGRGRRRTMLAAVAAAAVVALGAGTLFAITRDDEDNRISAGPSESADAPEEILAVIARKLMVVRAADGSVIRELPTDGPVQDLAAVPGGESIVYAQRAEEDFSCFAPSSVVRADPDGANREVLSFGTRPVVSPDGRFVAFVTCGPADALTVELRPLPRGSVVALPADGRWESPLAWTLDSKELLLATEVGTYQLVSVPDAGASRSLVLPAGVTQASFISEDELVFAYPSSDGDRDVLARLDLTTGTTQTVLESATDAMQIMSLSFDPQSGTLLVAVRTETASGFTTELQTLDANGLHDGPIVDGSATAVWYAPGEVSAVDTTLDTTTAPLGTTTTTESVTTTTDAFTGSMLPPPNDVAGFTEYRTVGLETLGATILAEAESPQAKVNALVAAFEDEPIEGRSGAEGVVNAIQGNRAQIEVRVLGVASDSHAGFDYRLYLLQEQPDGPWQVVSAEVRDLCSRAFDGSLCV